MTNSLTNYQNIQKDLKNSKIDAWLLLDFKGSNPIAHQVLKLPKSIHLTRRFAYLIPQQGVPIKLTHTIESAPLNHLPGKNLLFSTFDSFQRQLSSILEPFSTIALEISPMGENPYISYLDAGTYQFLDKLNKKLVSSGDLAQKQTAILTDEQLQKQQRATYITEQAIKQTCSWIKENLGKITEYDAQQFILNYFKQHGVVTDWPPIVAVNQNSANPHYLPSKNENSPIQDGDWLLIDCGCKEEGGAYADLTRVFVIQRDPTEEEQKIFDLVLSAFNRATQFLRDTPNPQGFEVDAAARDVIEQGGYGKYFCHRLGHSLTEEAHGSGAHLDSLETKETRRLLPNTCFTIEPGIYLPDQFGVRLESDIFLKAPGSPLFSDTPQQQLSSF